MSCKGNLQISAGFISNHNPLSANPTKWSNTLKQFVGNLPTNCLSVFDHFVKLALNGIMNDIFEVRGNIYNIKNFQSLYSSCKKNRFGSETVTYRSPRIWNLTPGNIKNVSSLENFKRENKKWSGEKCLLHVAFVKNTCKRWVLSKNKRWWALKKLAVSMNSFKF